MIYVICTSHYKHTKLNALFTEQPSYVTFQNVVMLIHNFYLKNNFVIHSSTKPNIKECDDCILETKQMVNIRHFQ